MELAALQSVVCDRRSRLIGFTCSPTRLPFLSSTSVFRRSPSPTTFVMGSSSRELRLSYRVLRLVPARCLSTASAFRGVSFLIATSTRRVHLREHPRLATFRPRRFARPRRFSPLLALRVYFTPQPRPGFALQGFSLRCSPITSSMTACPLAVSPYRLLPACADSANDTAPPSGLSSAPESVVSRKGLAPVKPDPLLSFTSSGFSVCEPSRRLHSSSALSVRSRGVGSAPRIAFSVFRSAARHASSLTCLRKQEA